MRLPGCWFPGISFYSSSHPKSHSQYFLKAALPNSIWVNVQFVHSPPHSWKRVLVPPRHTVEQIQHANEKSRWFIDWSGRRHPLAPYLIKASSKRWTAHCHCPIFSTLFLPSTGLKYSMKTWYSTSSKKTLDGWCFHVYNDAHGRK